MTRRPTLAELRAEVLMGQQPFMPRGEFDRRLRRYESRLREECIAALRKPWLSPEGALARVRAVFDRRRKRQ